MASSPPGPSSESELLQSGFRYALALTHHREEAEDLVQETWLNLSRRYGQVENRAVLFRSIRNLFIDQCRRKKLAAFESLDEAESMEPATIPEEEPGVQGELEALLAKLKPAERETIFLHYYQGHTAEEISKLTGRSRGTILSLLHRTLAKLRKFSAAAEFHAFRNQLPLWIVTLAGAMRLFRR